MAKSLRPRQKDQLALTEFFGCINGIQGLCPIDATDMETSVAVSFTYQGDIDDGVITAEYDLEQQRLVLSRLSSPSPLPIALIDAISRMLPPCALTRPHNCDGLQNEYKWEKVTYKLLVDGEC